MGNVLTRRFVRHQAEVLEPVLQNLVFIIKYILRSEYHFKENCGHCVYQARYTMDPVV